MTVASLREALKPFRASLHGALKAQLGTLVKAHEDVSAAYARQLGEDSGESAKQVVMGLATSAEMGDMSKITDAQVMTIIMVLALLWYSVQMILLIALINDSFDKHASLMSNVNVRHASNHAKRV